MTNREGKLLVIALFAAEKITGRRLNQLSIEEHKIHELLLELEILSKPTDDFFVGRIVCCQVSF